MLYCDRFPSMMMDTRLRKLKKIYCEIDQWAGDQEAVPRNLAAVQSNAKIAVIGEAIGPASVRLSGVNYFNQNGRLGPTGINLDRLLEPFGYTVYPPYDVTLATGQIECAPGEGRNTVYCTDLCPVFPGRSPARDGNIRRPSPDLIRSAIEHRFLEREIEIVKPKVILLLGEHAYKSFYQFLLHTNVQDNLSRLAYHLKDGDFPTYKRALISPLLHPSPASPTFARWFKSFPNSPHATAFVNLVQSYLKS